MRMRKKIGIVFVMMGAVLIFSALLLFLYNEYEDKKAGQDAEILLGNIQDYISKQQEETTESVDNMETSREEVINGTESSQMKVIEIEGYEYIGYITIPSSEMELPVMAEWDYVRLKLALCRQFGSLVTDDMVIAGHNYDSFFGCFNDLEIGEPIYFTDMDGRVHEYAIEAIEVIDPDSVDVVQNSGYDLTMYTCTQDVFNRIVVFCNRVEKRE